MSPNTIYAAGQCGLVLVFLIFILLPVETTKEEDEFVELYGDGKFILAGIWDELLAIHNDTEKLKYLCTQAHNKTNRVPGTVEFYRCDQRKVFFSDPKYEPIDMEMAICRIKELNATGEKPHYFYIGKGLAPDCVYYLHPEDPEAKTLMFKDHVCGIEIPV